MDISLLDQAHAHQAAGRLKEAEKLYQTFLSQHPNHPDATHLLGVAIVQLGRPVEGAQLIQRAIALNPNVSAYHANMGYAFSTMRRTDMAIRAYRNAVSLDPNNANAWLNLGRNLAAIGDDSTAIDAYHRTVALQPQNSAAFNQLGFLLRKTRRIDDAVNAFHRAIQIAPDFAEAHHNLATALADSGRIDLAVESEERAVQLAPAVAAPLDGRIYMLQFHPGYDRAALHREALRFNTCFAQPLSVHAKPHRNNRDSDRPLKVGYVSPDFYYQAECYFVLPLLRAHDRESFQIHCYSSTARPDEITRQFQQATDVWHDVARDSDKQLADRIRDDQIDILVDLTMHMKNNRLLLFARKPAPVQVTWLAYPGGTGLSAMDYRLTDAHLDPPDSDQFYFEKSIRLPNCWCCFDPIDSVTIDPQPAEFLRFASLNNPSKINNPTLALWLHALRAAPDSRLLLLTVSESHRRQILDYYRDAGINPTRIEFTGYLPRRQYLALLNTIDACLDPIPYNGITTSLDALSMGVPVITWPGETAPSRAGLSLLTTAGLTQFIARSPRDFGDIAARARDYSHQQIRDAVTQSPLFDYKQFAANVESAFRRMWHDYLKST